MSKVLSYILGIVTGVVLTFVVLTVIAYISSKSDGNIANGNPARLPEGVTLLDEPIPFTEARNFKVFQVILKDAALAQSEEKNQFGGDYVIYSDPIVLIVAEQENTFYDNQIVKAPKNCKVIQVGTYQYQTKLGYKTVPIIRFVKAQ